MKSLLDFIPLIIFFYIYKTSDRHNPDHPLLKLLGVSGTDNNHILAATAGLVLSMLVVYGFLFISQKFRFEKQQWLVLIMTIIFSGLTLALSDDYYIRLKAVLINLGFGLGLLILPWFIKDKEPAVKKLFGTLFTLSDTGWKKFNLAWAMMFFFMAGLHAFFAFVFMNGEYWGEFTAFGDIIVMIVFMLAMFYFLRHHINSELMDNKKS